MGKLLLGRRHFCSVALGGVGLGGGGVGGGGFLLAVLGHEDVVETVLLVEFVEVDITPDAADAASLAVLPKGVADGRGAVVVGYKDMVGAVLLACKVLGVDFLAGVYHGLDAVLLFHEFE